MLRVASHCKAMGQCINVGGGYVEKCFSQVRISYVLCLIPICDLFTDSPSIIEGWYNRPINGRRTKWTVSPHPMKVKQKHYKYVVCSDLHVLFPVMCKLKM
jgi:hypothetical protein